MVMIPPVKPERDCILFISSIPPKAEIWVDNTGKIGVTSANMMAWYYVPGGTHTISLKKEGYETWTGSYTVKWPQVRYFGQIILKPIQKSSQVDDISIGGVDGGALMTGYAGGQTSPGIMPELGNNRIVGSEEASVPKVLPISPPSI